jgi:muramoyltetrapeptide carboxypeptidase
MIWQPLNPGDTVDIVAPSSKCHVSVLDKIRLFLSEWGLNCHIPKGLFGDSLLYANSDEMRFEHLKNALLNPGSQAVWCLLGGFGANRLIPLLSQLKPPNHSKPIIGFSDITALHIFIQDQWQWPTIHGPSGYQAIFDKVSQDSLASLKEMLFNPTKQLQYGDIKSLNDLAKQDSIIDAPIIGGNLHLIQASIGTGWQMNAKNKIILIEEYNERAYRIDRILAQLSQTEIFNGAKAILFGDVIDKGEPDGRFLIADVLYEFAEQQTLPVLQISNIGHGFVNKPILLGSPARLTMGALCYLDFINH